MSTHIDHHAGLEAAARPQSAAMDSPTAFESGYPVRPVILIVDDDEMIRMIGTSALEQAGFVVAEATTGEEALCFCRELRPDVVLLDVNMPGIDGFDGCAKLRQIPAVKHTPILMLTGLHDLASIERAYDVGATDFVVKPVNWAILAHRMEYMLRASRAAQHLRESEARLANAQRIASLGYWEWDDRTRRLTPSNELLTIFDRSVDELSTLEQLLESVHPDDRRQLQQLLSRLTRKEEAEAEVLEYRVARSEHEERIVRQRAEAVIDPSGDRMRIMGTVQDLTEQRLAERQARFLADFDPLTGLPNRSSFLKLLTHTLARAPEQTAALLALDLDRFKRFNETLGEGNGDAILREVTERLRRSLRKSDAVSLAQDHLPLDRVARFGGDEFMVLLPNLHKPEDAGVIAHRLARNLERPFDVHGKTVVVTASVGVSVYPLDGEDAETLINNASSALRYAKQLGGGGCQFYTQTMNLDAAERLDLEGGLRVAVKNGELEVFYQPQFDAASGKVVGAEALLRWHHPELGLLPPGRFVPLAEESGIISEIGDWVLATACAQAMEWQILGFDSIRIGVNLSGRQFRDRALADRVSSTLSATRIDPTLLDLELTESILMDEGDQTIDMLRALKKLGISLSIDDFGVGFSSLSYLRHFPVDTLKIDRSFLKGVPDEVADVSLTKAILALARNLELRVVAEGVETRDQLRFLREEGCDELQGFLLARPMPASDVETLLGNNGASQIFEAAVA